MAGKNHYILDENGQPQVTEDISAWCTWIKRDNRRVAFSHVGSVEVSTVFLAIDHNFHGNGEPILWETCVFGAPDGTDHMRRYSSLNEAQEGHAEVVEEIKALAN